MKITKSQLKQIIKEELTNVLNEDSQLELPLALKPRTLIVQHINKLKKVLANMSFHGDIRRHEALKDLDVAERGMDDPPETFDTGVNNLVLGVAEKLRAAGKIDEDDNAKINDDLEAHMRDIKDNI